MTRILLALFLVPIMVSSLLAVESGPSVVVSIKPLHSLVAGVMQGAGEPQLLVKGGGSPHGYTLRPSEALALADAQLIVLVGAELEGFMQKPLATLASNVRQLALAEEMAPLLLPTREGGSWERHLQHHVEIRDETHPKDHGHHEEAVKHPHESEELDQHLWLSPLLAKQVVTLVRDALSDMDPGRKDLYARNATRILQQLDLLHTELQARLAPVKDVPYIVFHDAYQYFEAAYGLNAVGSITVDPERRPGVRRVREIREKINRLGARCLFSEPQFESSLVATIIEGSGTKTAILDPLGADLPQGPEAYFHLLKNLAENLRNGLE